jgi:gliding motility-associated lipoprotein GldH
MVRYKKDYEFSNLWLQTRHNLYGNDTLERVEVVLFNPDGSPKGKVLGNNCTIEAIWKKGVRWQANDSANIKLVQNMRKDPLPGVMNLGVKVIPVTAKN